MTAAVVPSAGWYEPSGREQQQLALAKAMLLHPRVLCIDELSPGAGTRRGRRGSDHVEEVATACRNA